MDLTAIICGNETFKVWDYGQRTFGNCALHSALAITYVIFAIVSAFLAGCVVTGGDQIDFRRKRLRKLLIVVRFLVSFTLFLVLTTSAFFTEPLAVMLANVLGAAAWFTHLIYVVKLGRAPHHSSRGSIVVTLIFILIVVGNCFALHVEYTASLHFVRKSFIAFTPIGIFALHVVYFATLILKLKHADDDFHEHLLAESFIDTGSGEESANFFSKISFWWVNTLMKKGARHGLERISDLFALPDELQSRPVLRQYEEKCEPRVLLWKTLARTFRFEFFCVGILKFSSDTLSFGGPILINKLIVYLETTGDLSADGFYYAAALFASVFVSSVLNSLFNFYIGKTTLKIRSCIIMSVYKKILQVSDDTLGEKYSSGEVINFVSTDTDRICKFARTLL